MKKPDFNFNPYFCFVCGLTTHNVYALVKHLRLSEHLLAEADLERLKRAMLEVEGLLRSSIE